MLKVLGVLFLMSLQGFANDLEPKQRDWTTWNGTQECLIESLFTPSTQEELIALVQKARSQEKKIKVIGAGHSLNAIALPEPGEWTVSLENYAKVLEIDVLNQTITVQGGSTLKQINEALDSHGLALENLGSISDQTVGGVFQTGTHGTGGAYGPLHTQIVGMTLINGKGELTTLSSEQSPLLFRACLCGLGTLGVVNTITLRAVPAISLHERTYAAPWPALLDQVEDLVQTNDHFRFYWFPYIHTAGVCLSNRTAQPRELLIAKDSSPFARLIEEFASEKIRSIEDVLELGPFDPAILTRFNRAFFEADYGKPCERIDRSDRIFNVDCSAHSHCCAMEASFPIRYTKSFMLELQELVETNNFPAHGGVEIRFVKADSALLSPTYSEDPDDLFCFVSIVSIRPNSKPIAYQPYFHAFQRLAEKYQGRLHWGKMGEFDPAYLKQVYPHWETFLELQKQEDPSGMFLNRFTLSLFPRG